jgi:hypothetical protein
MIFARREWFRVRERNHGDGRCVASTEDFTEDTESLHLPLETRSFRRTKRPVMHGDTVVRTPKIVVKQRLRAPP